MTQVIKRKKLLFSSLIVLSLVLGLIMLISWGGSVTAAASNAKDDKQDASRYIVLTWNDLGMHCYNRDFKDLAVLPPFNTLWAQVIEVGDPPQVVTSSVTVEFYFEDNTYSAGKSNFWDYAEQLFGGSLDPNVGLTGTGLSGEMEVFADHFEAVGIPLTEFSDSAPTTPYPYQLATIIVSDSGSGVELTRAQTVAPVSTEMHCDYCHYDNGPGNEDYATGVVEQNILSKHDEENAEEYPPGHQGLLMDRRPVLCAECHATNALGAPGAQGVPNLSNAMHSKHDGIVPDTLDGCYSCHPGPQTRCLRDVMSSSDSKIYCVDCHGTMYNVSRNSNPWLNEPRCDNAACHGSAYQQNHPLYRMSSGHGGIYCEGCHDSTHAIATSREPNDAIKFSALQGHPGTLYTCTVCHATMPSEAGPHGVTAPNFLYLPGIMYGSLP